MDQMVGVGEVVLRLVAAVAAVAFVPSSGSF